MDSCNARNVDPGFAAQYSIPSGLMTSSMKSDPGRSVVYTSARGGVVVSAAARRAPGNGVAAAVLVCAEAAACGSAAEGFATSAAAPAAAPFRNPRRFTEPFFSVGPTG